MEKKTINTRTRQSITTQPAESFPKPIYQLRIRNREIGKQWFYDFDIFDPITNTPHQFELERSNVDRIKYLFRLYSLIQNLWATSAGNRKQLQKELKYLGASLFLELFPEGLQHFFYTNSKHIDSIQLISDDPYIPWEFLVIRNPDKNKPLSSSDKFLAELGLTRWLYGASITNKLSIGKNKARYVIPEYLDPEIQLPASKEELSYLQKRFNAKKVNADPISIDKLLRKQGSFDLLHFCCHGEVDSNNIMHSRLMLGDRNNGKPGFLTQNSIEQCGSISGKNKKPVIVLNTCQSAKLGMKLTSFGGFANAFLKAGAGVFVGTHWLVEDNAAVKFISTFYDELSKGKNLSAATVAARKAAKGNDATWISYVVYGSPFAVLN